MTYHVFVSHSLAWGDELLIAQICGQLKQYQDIECHVAMRTWKFGPSVITPLEDAIAAADCVLAIVMNDGTATSYVNQEMGIALAHRKPVIAIAEDSAYLAPLLEKAPDIHVIDFESPEQCATGLLSRLAKLEVEKRIVNALSWALLGTLGWIFASRGA